jgi:hypothetical protein
LLGTLGAGRTVPAQEVSVLLGTEPVVDLVPTVTTDESLLPEVDADTVAAFRFSQLVECRVLSELLDDVPLVVDEPDEPVVPAAIRVPLGF